jgi:hypothetical protein
MSLKSKFTSFGHAIAAGAKYLEAGVLDALKVANKVQTVAPEVEAVVGALAGPQAQQISDLAFHALGSIAEAAQTVNTDATGDVAAKGLNIQMDIQTINDIKSAAATIQKVLALRGTPAPAPAAAVPANA